MASDGRAQSFFVDLGTDPATGVDRGSASVVSKVSKRTGFVTFSSTGAEDIGPYIASATLALPDAVQAGDQLDLVLVMGGMSQDNRPELGAAGIGYRVALPDTGLTFFANVDHSAYRIGSATGIALNARGTQTNMAVGIRNLVELSDDSRLTLSLELAARDSHSVALGATQTDERLRMIRAALRYDAGRPFGLRKRFGLSVTKGLGGLDATARGNPLASAKGTNPEFLRAAFSAETSVPLSLRYVVNAGVIGQWTADSLPVSQRCGYGTNAYARGFDRSYVNGDRCFGGRAELAYNVKLPDPRARRMDLGQLWLGVDGGWVEDLANSATARTFDTWSSIAAGYRMARGDFIGELAVSHVLDMPTGAFRQKDTRLWLQAAMRF